MKDYDIAIHVTFVEIYNDEVGSAAITWRPKTKPAIESERPLSLSVAKMVPAGPVRCLTTRCCCCTYASIIYISLLEGHGLCDTQASLFSATAAAGVQIRDLLVHTEGSSVAAPAIAVRESPVKGVYLDGIRSVPSEVV